MEALTKTNGEFLEQREIIVIPDYTAYFENCIDPKFGDYAKGAKTQLQFIFNAVEVSDIFPLGCCTTYRAFSSNDVIEIFSILFLVFFYLHLARFQHLLAIEQEM